MAVLPLVEYQIGVVCALTIEQAAMVAMLDEEHGVILEKDGRDDNVYFAGRIHHHNIVVACLPMGVDGIAAAAVVARDMLRTLTHLRFGLLVGIGGGIPNLDQDVDIRLGDVVVGVPCNTHGGVIQHDKGKTQADGLWERKGALNAPPTVLLTALHALQTMHELEDSQMPQYLAQMLIKRPRMSKSGYTFPGSEKDVFHKTNQDSTSAPGAEQVLTRDDRPNDEPHIHYGTIVSGNQVIKDEIVRDGLRDKYDALCVEMEAAGLMNDFPCLVIRGICDYADRFKNDTWHRYASATAAAFAKELLTYVSSKETSQNITGTLNDYLARQQEYHRNDEAQQRDIIDHLQHQGADREEEKRQACHRVFKTSDYEGGKNRNPEAVAGTCQWAINHPRFQEWRASNRHTDLLWISADPGCGKSTLCKYLADMDIKLSNSKPYTICYFFFKTDDEEQDGMAAALCAIIHQLFSRQPWLIVHALKAYRENGEELAFQTNELWRIFENAINDENAEPVFCILDALDECQHLDRAVLIHRLCHLYSSSPSRSSHNTSIALKLLVTSRPYEDVRSGFEEIPLGLPSIRLRGEDESDQIRKEIDLVITARMKDLTRELRLSSIEANKVKQQLLDIEHRTYLWLYLAIDEIRRIFRRGLRSSDKVIPLISQSVEDAYEKILSRVVDLIERQHAKTILTIIVGARRPLTVSEMAIALDMATLPKRPTSLADLTIDAAGLDDKIRHWCGLFVSIKDGKLYLLHQTAREFLMSHNRSLDSVNLRWRKCLSFIEVERDMAKICIFYLCLVDFNVDNTTWFHATVQSFLNFASEHWVGYTRNAQAELDSDTKESMRALYDPNANRFRRWINFMLRMYWFEYDQLKGSIMHLAAFHGHHLALQRILTTSKLDIDSRDGKGQTALGCAVMLGYEDTVRVLVENGADVEVYGSQGTPLRMAFRAGHKKIIEMLLEQEAYLGICTVNDRVVLHEAAQFGYEDIVQLLIRRGVDMNSRSDSGRTVLCIASKYEHEEMRQMLLQNGAVECEPDLCDLHAQRSEVSVKERDRTPLSFYRVFQIKTPRKSRPVREALHEFDRWE